LAAPFAILVCDSTIDQYFVAAGVRFAFFRVFTMMMSVHALRIGGWHRWPRSSTLSISNLFSLRSRAAG
jgi:hypothetical protein